ncbi:hypothetical protein [Enterovirga aerilata]|uniref:Adenylate cyclase n=1 Tax=Enterovirga aerilata TaxID=2730920 RepID=A0A849I545_9HYPH|nr:hypothetical protein [Enterovirga sp. DB1703]NNM72451.1 hypothetical protein [Enterovirga sp. DB1703]
MRAGLVFALAAAGLAFAPAAAFAQNSKPGCTTAAPAQPATPPSQGKDAGTAPGGMGTSGWTGGLGGAYVGTNPQGSASGSSSQPATAQGLDPTSGKSNAAC